MRFVIVSSNVRLLENKLRNVKNNKEDNPKYYIREMTELF